MSESTLKYPLLIIDAASRTTWVGLKTDSGTLISNAAAEDPSKALFPLIEELLESAQLTLQTLGSIAYCQGPGSMLGLRSAAMAIRSWQAIGIPAAQNAYAYTSLHLGAFLAHTDPSVPSSGWVITDARRSSWNALPFPAKPQDAIKLIESDILPSDSAGLVSLESFPMWTKIDFSLINLPYDPARAFKFDSFHPFLDHIDLPEPLITRAADYKKWDAKIHSSPKT